MFFKYVKLPAGMKPYQEKPPSFQPSWKKRDAKQQYQYTPFQSQEQGTPVVHPSVDNECKLKECEIFKFVFHRSHTQDLDMRMDNGEEMCIAFHSKGKCFSTCKRALSHFTLSKNKKMKCRMIVGSCRDKQKAFCDNPKKGRFSLPPQTTYQKQNQQQGNQWQQNWQQPWGFYPPYFQPYQPNTKIPPPPPPQTTTYPNLNNGAGDARKKNGEK
mmetsp:Transcript_42700/g.51942  ORF Transcript_42700/g.51942 Transcript_42700/m.51942 type:complete len:214 (+) Transcript_42700:1424-2065(+)